MNPKFIVTCLAVHLLGCSDSTPGPYSETAASQPFKPAPPNAITSAGSTDKAPVYVFLFAHTEDHINHQASEERYHRLLPELERIETAWPATQIVWNIMFQGADAATVGERNTDGVAQKLRDAAAAGRVAFGYHAQHDPTTQNRPQSDLDENATWDELLEAVHIWITCRKHPTKGGCLSPTGGGAEAILEHFGPVESVSGVVGVAGAFVEGDPVRHAILRTLPERMVGFGFSDHAPGSGPEYDAALQQLMTILTPGLETSASLFWMDGALRINDGEPLAGIAGLRLMDPTAQLVQKATLLDRSRPNLFKVSLGSKWIYTRQEGGNSPTNYAYANPETPELPPMFLNDAETVDAHYANSASGLDYLAGQLLADNESSRFVGGDELVALVAPEEYWQVSDEVLDGLARWILGKWNDGPPPYASDGIRFYSLRDVFGLLARSIAMDYPDSLTLLPAYGPATSPSISSAREVNAIDVGEVARTIATALESSGPWAPYPSQHIEGTYPLAGEAITATQLLYIMAFLYTAHYSDHAPGLVHVPETLGNPNTLPLLETLGCLPSSCAASAWSLKPARLPLQP